MDSPRHGNAKNRCLKAPCLVMPVCCSGLSFKGKKNLKFQFVAGNADVIIIIILFLNCVLFLFLFLFSVFCIFFYFIYIFIYLFIYFSSLSFQHSYKLNIPKLLFFSRRPLGNSLSIFARQGRTAVCLHLVSVCPSSQV